MNTDDTSGTVMKKKDGNRSIPGPPSSMAYLGHLLHMEAGVKSLWAYLDIRIDWYRSLGTLQREGHVLLRCGGGKALK